MIKLVSVKIERTSIKIISLYKALERIITLYIRGISQFVTDIHALSSPRCDKCRHRSDWPLNRFCVGRDVLHASASRNAVIIFCNDR